MSKLAIHGGKPVRATPFPAYRVIGAEEREAVAKVMESGILSRFLGAWHPDFFGGPVVQEFEKAWAETFTARHAVSVNSATSGLYAAIGASGVGPGDEVIVPPWTMSASATAPLIFNAVPVFADIDPDTYCLSAETIRARLTPRTKAVVVVHIFGRPAEMGPIMELANERGLIVIEDCAQAPFATYHGRPVGTLGHMGVFSLNYHKHIHSGEGGVVTTNDDRYCERLQLIRNHAESVVEAKGVENLINMIGFNFRLGEIEAAIGLCQLRKGADLVRQRQDNVAYLSEKLRGIPGLAIPEVPVHISHAFYVHPMLWDASATRVPRADFLAAVKAELPVTELREGEGVLLRGGYVRPLYRLPLFQQRIGYGAGGCPFTCPQYDGQTDYSPSSFPHVEAAQESIILHELMRPPMTRADLDDVAAAFVKVAENIQASPHG